MKELSFFAGELALALVWIAVRIAVWVRQRRIDWKRELAAKLISLQREDGSWVNENNRFWENDPALVTSFAILALSLAK